MHHPLLRKTSVFIDGLDHPECVAIHPDGSIWAGGEGGQIYRMEADGSGLREVANTGGFILGIAFSPGGEWLAVCDLGKQCIWKYDLENSALELFAEGCGGHSFNIPNYAVFDAEGNIYISESGAFREVNGKVLKFDADGNGHVWHEGPFNFANGMALAPDGKHLFIVCSFLPGVEKVTIKEDGSAGKRKVFCTLPQTVPDGLAFDLEGNLYVSCYAPNAIYRVTQDGHSSVLVEDWEAHTITNPTNIAFGGPDLDQLFTANLGRWHLSKIDLGIKGLPLASHFKSLS